MATLTSPNESCQYPLWPLIGPIFLGLPSRTWNSFYPGSPESILSFKSSPLALLLLSSVCFYVSLSICHQLANTGIPHCREGPRSWRWIDIRLNSPLPRVCPWCDISSRVWLLSFLLLLPVSQRRFQLPDANIQIQFPSLERLEIESRALATTTETETRCKHDGRKTNNARWRSQQLVRWEKMASGHGRAPLCGPGTGDIC